jgi:uncharacterized damage-inducible protein DinB
MTKPLAIPRLATFSFFQEIIPFGKISMQLKSSNFGPLSMFLLFALVGADAQCQTPGPPQVFLDRVDRAFDYTRAIADAMPDSLYSFKPTEEVFSFGKQLQHGIKTVVRHSENYFLGALSEDLDQRFDDEALDKIAVIAQIDQAYKEFRAILEGVDHDNWQRDIVFFSGTFPAFHFFSILLDHLTHHRAMAIVYLRLNGIAPPVRYVGW